MGKEYDNRTARQGLTLTKGREEYSGMFLTYTLILA